MFDSVTPPRLSTIRLLLAHFGAALTLFLATTDATIVSTALPTITSQFNASQTEYTWVSVMYMLTQTAFQPLYGRVSDLIGRMTVLYTSLVIFAAGSALCGTAQSIRWLIIARAIAGIGGGGIVSLVWTITSEIVAVQNQAKWSQALSVTWACSAVAGPLLGGLFSEKSGILNWRWASIIIIWLSLRSVDIGSSRGVSWQKFGQTFDFIGLVLFMSGSSCIVIGFNFASQLGWTAPATWCTISAGFVVLILGGFYEVRTSRDALFPPIAFKDLTIVVILVITFLHNFAFNAGTFYLALYFQVVDGLSPLKAGITMLPYSLGSSLASMPTAWFIGWWQRRKLDTSGQKIMICVGLVMSTAGFGLMILLDERTAYALQSVYPLIAGLGIGMLFHAPYQVFTRALRRRDVAAGTSAFFLVRFTGATVGLSVAGAVFHSRLSKTLPAGMEASVVLEWINSLQPYSNKAEVVHALSLSIQAIWAVCCPCLGVALLISMFTRKLSIEDDSGGDPEKASGSTLTQDSTLTCEGEAGA
ncbi:putative transporter C3H1.06c [Grifola frondosa]|uniref:Putative transporter C3H1.06c n=1 Tax=Grifola frondosa TaxID=5627 RepID=A0A1C7MRI7_GRIFR|nr:putative transporter C3H1.06c [Grifola frondosa]